MVDLVDAQLEKLNKLQFVSVNVKLINFLMEMEIAILVDQTKSFPINNASVLLDIPVILVESALLHVVKDNSPSKEDVLSAPSTPSTKLKSTDAIAPPDITRISSEYVKNLS